MILKELLPLEVYQDRLQLTLIISIIDNSNYGLNHSTVDSLLQTLIIQATA